MKRLILVRHAKTEIPQHGISDFERRLKSRGHADAKLIARQLKEKQILPDLYISSKAKRAKQTAEIFAHYLNFPLEKIEFQQFIYDGYTTGEFIDYLSRYGDKHDCIIVFGHNPEIAMLAINLTDESFYTFPTTATVAIDYDVESWNQLASREGKISAFLYPSQFKTE